MQVIYSVENESFKLRIDESGKHNFQPRKHRICLSGCKNSFAAFQIILQCDEKVCINVGQNSWFSEFDNMSNIRLAHEGLLRMKLQHIDMHLDDKPVLYADALLNNEVVSLTNRNTPASIFVTIPIGESTKAGIYNGKILIYSQHMFDDEEHVGEIQYTLRIHEITLPEPAKGKFYLDLWQHNSNIARKAEVRLWSDRHFEIIEPYIKCLADLGQRAISVVVSEVPWCGQRCFLDKETPSNMFEYSMVTVEKNSSGEFIYHYDALDRYIEMCMENGIKQEIEVFGLVNIWVSFTDGYYNFTNYIEAIRIRYKDIDGTYKYMKKTKDIESYIKALYTHFIDKGWIDKVRVIADEPWEIEPFKQSIYYLKQLAPGFKLKAAIGDYNFYDEYKTEISDFVPSIICLCNEYDRFQADKDNSHRFLWYVACTPDYPNMILRSNLLEERYIAILTAYFGFEGFLRWNFTVWPKNPRQSIRFSLYPAGDTNFVYPAGDMTPLLSLRYMSLKRAIEDFELIQMVREKGGEATIQEVYSIIIKSRDFGSHYEGDKCKLKFEDLSTTKYTDYEKARELLYSALLNSNKIPE